MTEDSGYQYIRICQDTILRSEESRLISRINLKPRTGYCDYVSEHDVQGWKVQGTWIKIELWATSLVVENLYLNHYLEELVD